MNIKGSGLTRIYTPKRRQLERGNGSTWNKNKTKFSQVSNIPFIQLPLSIWFFGTSDACKKILVWSYIPPLMMNHYANAYVTCLINRQYYILTTDKIKEDWGSKREDIGWYLRSRHLKTYAITSFGSIWVPYSTGYTPKYWKIHRYDD